MRTKVGVLTAGLVASVLSFGSPTAADTTTTTTDETSTTVGETTTTEGTTTTSIEETATTVEETATTVDETTTSTTEPCDTTTTVPESTTASSSVAPDTTVPCDDTTTTSLAEPQADEPAPDPSSSTSTSEPGEPVGPAVPGAGTPGRGTQVQSRPLPPKPTTTTTTTTTLPPVPSYWQLPANSGSGRRVVYSKSLQRVWVVDSSGNVIKRHLVSGRQTPRDPSPGNYRVWSRSRYTFSINNPSITWGYMVRFAWGARGGNIGFHEIPYQYGRPVQSVSQLGTALSGGCVRQAKPDAIWMWNWAQLGTRVVVLG